MFARVFFLLHYRVGRPEQIFFNQGIGSWVGGGRKEDASGVTMIRRNVFLLRRNVYDSNLEKCLI